MRPFHALTIAPAVPAPDGGSHAFASSLARYLPFTASLDVKEITEIALEAW
jgi:hypothetical protein